MAHVIPLRCAAAVRGFIGTVPVSGRRMWPSAQRGRGAHFDPVLLDAFRRISGGVHVRVGNRSDDELKALLAAVIEKYFG